MTAPFSRASLWIVVAVAATSLVAAAALTVLDDDLATEPAARTDTYSTSAIGHRALLELLRELDIPVERSRAGSAGKAKDGLLIVLAPDVSTDDARARLATLVDRAGRALVVLPKWYGRAAAGVPWIDEASLVAPREAKAVLDALSVAGEVGRSTGPVAWQGDSAPELAEAQTIESDALGPIISDTEGRILLGLRSSSDASDELWVLADPDALSNHGLARPTNAAFAVGLIERLRRGGPVVIDETVHGYSELSLVRLLLRFPLVLVTVQTLVCAALAIWAAMVGFGPRRAAPPPLAPGKDFLISNTAALLQYSGHHAHALRRYLAQSVAAVRQALNAPALPPEAVTAWLEDVRRARGLATSLAQLEVEAQAVDRPQRALELADRVHRWRMEMIHGANRRS